MTPEEWIRDYVSRKTQDGKLTPRILVGSCGAACKEMAAVFPNFTIVPGWACTSDDEDDGYEHVWCVDESGTIYDPTKAQFNEPIAHYRPWKPGDTVRTGKCMNCGWDIYRAVQSLECPSGHDYVCGLECAEALERDLNG